MYKEPSVPVSETAARVDRAPRRAVEFPLDFITETGQRVPGTCENLSQSGLLALFASPLDIWTEGEVDLHFGSELLGVRARVARAVELRAGLAFLQVNAEVAGKLRELVRAAGDGTALSDTL